MFGWKRQRKEEPVLECAALRPPLLGSSPAAVLDAAAPGLSPGSAANSECSEDEAEFAAPSGSGSGSGNGALAGGRSTSIELATHHRLQPVQVERASVRSKAAFFEALIRTNTTTHIQCSAEGTEHCTYPSTPELCNYPNYPSTGSTSGHLGAEQQLGDAIMRHADSEEGAGDSWQDYSEVHMVLRMPRARPPGEAGSGKYGSVAEMEALIEQMQGALEVKDRQHKAAVQAYTRRSCEVENLMGVVRELTESRSKAVSQRSILAEKYAELQQEYHRMLRIADLSRTVSKENMAKTSRTRTELRRVQLELHATKNHACNLNEKNMKVRVENLLLKEKVTLLERLDFEEVQESEIKKHYTRYRMTETY